MKTLEVLLTPAEFAALPQRDLRETVCVVFDILRATSSMMNALANGAKEIIPVAEISEAIALWKQRPDILLAGERDGVRIDATQSGGIDFDLGNSPREFSSEKISGKTIVMTTTNGTRALRACVAAKTVLIGSFLNLRAVANWIKKQRPENLLLVCAGTFQQAAYEDVLAAGALAEIIWPQYRSKNMADSAIIARQIFVEAKKDFSKTMTVSRNALRLLARPDLRGDVACCFQRDTLNFVAELKKGIIQKI